MRLCDLIKKEEICGGAFTDTDVYDISDKPENVSDKTAYFHIGNDDERVMSAVRSGAVAVISCVGAKAPNDVSAQVIRVPDVRYAYALACQRFYGEPSKKMKLIAVTGTNGKTTTSHAVAHILSHAGHKTGIIGTVGNYINGKRLPASYTTPPPREMAKLLKEMNDAEAEFAVIEASSHALDQSRTGGLTFDVGIFTNLSRDHLDYHKTEESYAASKSKLFSSCRHSVINLDDAHAKDMAFCAAGDVYYVSAKDKSADFFADDIVCAMKRTDFSLSSYYGKIDVKTSLTGDFNVYNVALAAAAARIAGVENNDIASALADFSAVEGRTQAYEKNGVTAVIDFAHTPDALEKVILSLRPLTSGRIITVFGCGGNRDRGKRPIMGAIAEKYSDKVILTSDNPRNERPNDIINDIMSGISDPTKVEKIQNRADAIFHALNGAKRGDTVLIAGKGHEKYIEDEFGKSPFSDKEQVKKIFYEDK